MPGNTAAHARTRSSRPVDPHAPAAAVQPASRVASAVYHEPDELNGRAAPRSGTAAGGSMTGAATLLSPLGPPPHARGRHLETRREPFTPRTTPACAGTISRPRYRRRNRSDHPRERGDDMPTIPNGASFIGSTPRARGRRQGPGVRDQDCRITSRVRGEDLNLQYKRRHQIGPPPRARGRLPDRAAHRVGDRITPACAGTA